MPMQHSEIIEFFIIFLIIRVFYPNTLTNNPVVIRDLDVTLKKKA